jgi:type IV pilus assembly protein PilP
VRPSFEERADGHGTVRMALILATAFLVTACSSPSEELQAWTEQQRREVKFGVQPLPPPGRFEPQLYLALQEVDPFNAQKLSGAMRQEVRQMDARMSAELNRRREPLEAFPLDAMALTGSVLRQGHPVALIAVDKLLYQVKLGDYMGQNYGRVVKIEESRVELREIVQDASGEWVERITTLQMQEKAR